ncbi:MAG: MG2 domain-containing protein [Lentimicrobiaceae bacterium]|nr:MG2 domain-containing protein [Lentimicrobiaceae bacterium]
MNLFGNERPAPPEDYEKLWKQVEKFNDEALPQSALQAVEQIYTLAMSENNEKQIIKAIVHKMSYTKTLDEEGAKKSIMAVELEMASYRGIVKPFMHLFLATMYDDYVNRNSYTINQRSVTANFENNDIDTWDKTKFQNKIVKNYLLALNDILKKEEITAYSEFINDVKESKTGFPTLYDFVAYHAINQLGAENYYYFGARENNDKLKDNAYLSDVETFVKMQWQGDTLSYKNTALKIFQNWLKFRLEDSKNREALVNTDFMRLNFVKNNLTTANRDKVWETAVVALQKKHATAPELAQINWELADFYNNLGSQYNFQDSTTFQYKTYKTKAIVLLNDVISRFPEAKYAPACVNLKNEIEKLSFSFQSENVVNANEKFPLRITYCNANTVYMTILKCDYEKFLETNETKWDFSDFLPEIVKLSEKVIDSKIITLPKAIDYNSHSTEYLTDALPYGFYVILLHAKKELKIEENYFAHLSLFSSHLCMTTKAFNNSQSGLYILNSKTGQPVENAKVDLYVKEYDSKSGKYVSKKETTIYTDKTGYAKVYTENGNRWSKSYRVDVSYKNDYLSHNSHFHSYTEVAEKKRTEINFFTDRAIYRPGQTVHFKGICLEKVGEEVTILPKQTVKVEFKDMNWQNIEMLNLVSNEYGTISGSFTIPLGVLTGHFTIQTTNGSHSIRVEEYKRPMFEAKMLPVEGEYKINDMVTVEGVATTYAGTALSDAKVSYTVTRNPLWRLFYLRMPAEEIAFGDLVLDNEGKFKIEFKAVVDEIMLLQQYVAYNYIVNVTVTDINGETQTTSTSVLVSNRALEVSTDISSCMLREAIDSISIKTQNASGAFVPANVNIQIFKLKDNKLLVAKKQWEHIDMPLYSKDEWYKEYPGQEFNGETDFSKFEIEKSVYQKQINTATLKKIKIDDVEKWNSGVYRMVLSSVDKWGNPVKSVQEFVLFSEKDKKMPANLTHFFYVDKTSALPGETVTLYVGSSYKDVHLFYDLGVKNKLAKSEIIKLSSEITKINIPVSETDRGGLSINLMFVKNGRTYEYTQSINVNWEHKKLDIKFITFRNKTLPGANESWQLKISDHLSQAAQAEFMASLYDASLDVFAKNSWELNPYSKYNFWLNWDAQSFNTTPSLHAMKNFYPAPLSFNIAYPSLTLFQPYSTFVMSRGYAKSRPTMNMEEDYSEEVLLRVVEDNIRVNTDFSFSQDFAMDELAVENSHKGVLGSGQAPVQIRQNFAETAFFYPTLTTNEAGEVFLKFTMPESLTRWNFMGLAHTKDLKIGTINEEIVTQKELMVMPNLPRFFRENDKMTISAKINNVSPNNMVGIAKIEFFDVETLKSLNLKFLNSANEVDFKVAKDGNTVAEWQITVPEGLSAVGIRIIADGRNHSDGEERILPVLTNKMLVTESLPLPVRKAGTTNFKFNSLLNSAASKTLRHESYTLEFTANPAWYAVQALPYLMEYPFECAEQVFSRFYANSLSSHIANSDPKIKRVFELWKTIPESKALLSNLEKNQELKALLIEETPWLLNAKDETERKRRIGILFDLNRMAMENNTAIQKLSETQLSNGAFPWFRGMSESWYITQHIVGGFAHLDKLGVTEIRKNSTVWNMIQKSITFLDKQLEKSYTDLKKHCNDECLKKDNLGYMQIQYLYVRSFFIQQVPLPESAKAAFDYYKSQAIKYWTKKEFYMQGMIALALYKYGEPQVPAKIVASLKEHALRNEEMGTYWKYNNSGFWHQAPIETQALLIEVFSDVANDQKWVDEMKVWLLKQKQTQDWRTTKATTDAIYALLLQGTDLLAETDYPIIKIGDMTLDVAADPEIKTEAGTGYFKKRWDGASVTPTWSNVSVTKNANSVSWGAVYWQYFEQLDKIKQFKETPLTINKQLFVERRSGNKTVIVPVENDGKLNVGDKVTVRIEIRTDRDMEYVHLKDMRAACFEPTDYASGYRYKSGFGYYQAIKDASMNFFIDYLHKGVYVFEYTLRVAQKGEFSNGITTMQSMYAPEFTSHSEGVRVVVGE